MLLKTSCRYWGQSDTETTHDFSLYSKNYEHIMGLNCETDHPSHKVANYFRSLRIHEPVLNLYASKDAQSHLNKDNYQVLNKLQKQATVIPNYNNKWSMARHKINQQTIVEKEKEKITGQNKDKFSKAFPGIMHYNMEESKKEDEEFQKRLDPDVFFPTFIVNLILTLTTIMTILYGHAFTTEYYMIQNMSSKF